MARVWRSEDIFLKSTLCFHCVSPRDSSQFILLGGRHLFPLRHLADPEVKLLVTAVFHSEVQWEESRFLLTACAAHAPEGTNLLTSECP